MAVAGLLAAIATPAVKGLYNSMINESAARTMISSALANARSIALSRGKYAGVRFQQDTEGNQYMIFIIHDPRLGASFFRAVEGKQPVKLPENFGVMDLRVVDSRNYSYPDNCTFEKVNSNNEIDEQYELDDVTTFSILFSPSGKLIVKGLYVRNRDNRTSSDSFVSYDPIFNIAEVVEGNVSDREAMFYQDEDNDPLGIGVEKSRRSFVIYDKNEFKKVYENGNAWSEYLYKLKPIYVNAYSGELIKKNSKY